MKSPRGCDSAPWQDRPSCRRPDPGSQRWRRSSKLARDGARAWVDRHGILRFEAPSITLERPRARDAKSVEPCRPGAASTRSIRHLSKLVDPALAAAIVSCGGNLEPRERLLRSADTHRAFRTRRKVRHGRPQRIRRAPRRQGPGATAQAHSEQRTDQPSPAPTSNSAFHRVLPKTSMIMRGAQVRRAIGLLLRIL